MAGFDRSFIYIQGAYGREANHADWLAGKDFKIQSGPYCSIRDLPEMQKQGLVDLIFVNHRNSVVFVENL